MQTVTLGTTNITVNKNRFGALPIDAVAAAIACHVLRASKSITAQECPCSFAALLKNYS